MSTRINLAKTKVEQQLKKEEKTKGNFVVVKC